MKFLSKLLLPSLFFIVYSIKAQSSFQVIGASSHTTSPGLTDSNITIHKIMFDSQDKLYFQCGTNIGSYDGTTWDIPTTYPDDMELFLDSNDQFHRMSYHSGNNYLYVNSTAHEYGTFGPYEIISSPDGAIEYINYVHADITPDKLYIKRKNSSGWTTIENITNGSKASMAVTSSGTLYYSYYNSSTNTTYLKYYDGSSSTLLHTRLGAFVDYNLKVNRTDELYNLEHDNSSSTVYIYKFSGSDWTEVTHVDSVASVFTHQTYGFDHNNVLYLVYPDKTTSVVDQQYHCSVKKYDGTNWSYVGMPGFSSGGVLGNIRLAFNSQSIPFVSFKDNITDQFVMRKFNGTIWIDVLPTSFSFGPVAQIDGKIASDETPYWGYFDLSLKQILVKKNIAGQWTDVGTPVATFADTWTSIHTTLDMNDVPSVFYRDLNDGGALKLKKYISGAWTQIGGNITGSDPDINYTKIAYEHVYDKSNRPCVSYTDNGSIYVKRYNGTQWEQVGGVVYNNNLLGVQIELDTADNIHVVYVGGAGVIIKKFNGTIWSTLPLATTQSKESFSFVIDKVTNQLYLATRDFEPYYEITVKKFDGSAWQLLGIEEFAEGTSLSLAVDKNGYAYLGFHDRITKRFKLMYYAGTSWQNISTAGNSPLQYGLLSLGNDGLYVTGGSRRFASMWKYTNCGNTIHTDVSALGSVSCVGNTKRFNVNVSGLTTDVRWQVDRGTGFIDLQDNNVFKGTHSVNFSLIADDSLHGFKFRCIATNCNGSNTSSSITLSVFDEATITTHEVDVTACANTQQQFFIKATGGDNSYQWRVNKGSGLEDITGDPNYSGEQTDTLTIANITTAMSNYIYQCRVSSSGCNMLHSTGGTLIVNPVVATAPSISSQPSTRYMCVGNVATFPINASNGANTVNYQWQLDTGGGFSNIPAVSPYLNVTANNLGVNPVAAAMNGHKFRCITGSVCGPTTISNTVILYVNEPVEITTHPVNRYICNNGSTSFSALINAHSQSYASQWQVDQGSGFVNLTNGAPYSNVTSLTMNISNATTAMNNYKYRCVITICNGNGPAYTNEGTLSVGAAPTISAHPTSVSACVNDNALFSVTGTGGPSLTYQWQVNQGGSFSNISGATSSSLSLTGITAGMNNYQYRCILRTSCNATSTSNAALLNVGSSTITISLQPQNKTTCEGTPTSFSVNATGGAAYQWQVDDGGGFSTITDNSMYSGATSSTLNLTSVTTSMMGYLYRCVLSSPAGCASTVNSNNATLTVSTNAIPTITGQPQSQTICSGNTFVVSTTATGTGLTYQWQVDQGSGFNNLSNIYPYQNVTTSSLTFLNPPVSTNGYKYRCVVNNLCNNPVNTNFALLSVEANFLTFTTQPTFTSACPTESASYHVALEGSGLTYQWSVNMGSGYVSISDDATYSGSTTSTLSLTNISAGMNNYQYRCEADNQCSAPVSSSGASLSVKGAPVITAQPSGPSVCEAQNTSISVGTSGTVNYTWQEDNGTGFTALSNTGSYSGTSTSTLTISNASLSMGNYSYRCIISNGCPVTTTSNAVLLTVNPKPSVSASANPSTSICSGTSLILSGNGALTYSWNQGVTNNTSFTPLSSNTYTVTGTGAHGCQATAQITVNVNTCTDLVSELSDHIYVSPNPFVDKFFLSTSHLITGTVEVSDINGKIIHRETIHTDKTEITLPQQASGIYFLRMISNEGQAIFSGKINKQ